MSILDPVNRCKSALGQDDSEEEVIFLSSSGPESQAGFGSDSSFVVSVVWFATWNLINSKSFLLEPVLEHLLQFFYVFFPCPTKFVCRQHLQNRPWTWWVCSLQMPSGPSIPRFLWSGQVLWVRWEGNGSGNLHSLSQSQITSPNEHQWAAFKTPALYI